jgi:hypothetical protein
MKLGTMRPDARAWMSAVRGSARSRTAMMIAALAVLGACAGKTGTARSANGENPTRDTRMEHEDCDLKAASEKVDANRDGHPEIVRVGGGKPRCEAFDLNQDGALDLFAYYDPQGQVRRREMSYGRDARITEIRIYKGGIPVEVRQATALPGKADTWHVFANGVRARTERDTDGNGDIDEWWEYPDSTKPDCPMMYRDTNNDGTPEKKEGVDLCATGYVPPERKSAQPVTPNFERGGEPLPEEVDRREEGSAPAQPGKESGHESK